MTLMQIPCRLMRSDFRFPTTVSSDHQLDLVIRLRNLLLLQMLLKFQRLLRGAFPFLQFLKAEEIFGVRVLRHISRKE